MCNPSLLLEPAPLLRFDAVGQAPQQTGDAPLADPVGADPAWCGQGPEITLQQRACVTDHVPALVPVVDSDERARGEQESARALSEDAYDLYRQRLGPDHPETVAAAEALADNLRALGRPERAHRGP